MSNMHAWLHEHECARGICPALAWAIAYYEQHPQHMSMGEGQNIFLENLLKTNDSSTLLIESQTKRAMANCDAVFRAAQQHF
jgi:hypothetical protein